MQSTTISSIWFREQNYQQEEEFLPSLRLRKKPLDPWTLSIIGRGYRIQLSVEPNLSWVPPKWCICMPKGSLKVQILREQVAILIQMRAIEQVNGTSADFFWCKK